MKHTTVLTSIFTSVALSVSAQEVQWQLVDTGVLSHSLHGKGVEMRIQADPVPNDFFDKEDIGDILLDLCNYYAPTVLPFVRNKMQIEDPDFIAVRVISGGFLGRYVLERYAIADGQCGEVL